MGGFYMRTIKTTYMKKILVILAVVLAVVETLRVDSGYSLVLAFVIVQLVYGRDLYKAWYKNFLRGDTHNNNVENC